MGGLLGRHQRPSGSSVWRSWPILGTVLAFIEPKRLVLALGKRSSPSSRVSAGGLLPVLLIVAVLLCHGILGFAHQVLCDECGPAEVSGAHQGAAAGMGGAGSGHAGGNDAPVGLEGHSYATVVLAAIGTALLVLLLGVRRWREVPVPRSIFQRRYPPFIACRPRGPTLPFLQVLRL